MELKKFDEAAAYFARVRALGTEVSKVLLAFTRFYEARALVDSGKDRAGGLAAAKKARAELVGSGDEVGPDLPDIDRWLAAQ